jgi:4-hydroxybenzoate polyprenyltransferase
MPWLQLIRWQNLLIIFLTQFLAWWCVVLPESPKILTPLNFCCLTLSTMLIAAAGYIINDYFDIKIDSINKPHKVVLEKAIPRKQAIIAHAVLNIVALAFAGYVAAQAHHYEWLLLQALCILLLWFYSTDLKRQYIIGNLAVALLTSFTILVLFIYEPVMQQEAQMPLIPLSPGNNTSSLPVWVLAVYAYFAFMLTWMREIVKDMEDLKGDEAEGCVTMPVKRGLEYATRFTMGISLLAIIPLLVAAITLFKHDHLLLSSYLLILLVVPLVIWSVFMSKGTTEQHYHKASTRLKLIMILGICSLLIYHF